MLGYSHPGDLGEAAYIVTEGTAVSHTNSLISATATELLLHRLHSRYGISQLLARSRQITSAPEHSAYL